MLLKPDYNLENVYKIKPYFNDKTASQILTRIKWILSGKNMKWGEFYMRNFQGEPYGMTNYQMLNELKHQPLNPMQNPLNSSTASFQSIQQIQCLKHSVSTHMFRQVQLF